MAEPLPLFGSTPADAREMALTDVLQPVAGWIFAHRPGAQRVELHLTQQGAGFRFEIHPPHPGAVEAACLATLGQATPRAEPTSWRAAFAGSADGLLARATRAPQPRAGWASHAVVRSVRTAPPAPPTPEEPPEDPDMLAFWEDLAARDHVEALYAHLAPLMNHLDEIREPSELDTALLDALDQALRRARGLPT